MKDCFNNLEEVMLRSNTQQIFLLKMTLGVMIGNAAGRTFASGIYFSGRWDGAFINSFFPLLCIFVVQWILISDYLPKRWLITGLIGSVISATVMGTINYSVSEQIFRLIIGELNVFSALIMGILVALPQWFVLKQKNGYLWVVANGTGWALSAAFRNLVFYPQMKDFLRTLIVEISFMPLGLLLSMYLYSYVKSNTQGILEDNKVN